MVTDEMEARRRDQGSELLEKLLRLKNDVGGAVAPAMLQSVEEPAIVEPRQPLRRDRRPRHVAGQAFEPPAVTCGDRDVRVQAHATDARAALALEHREIVHVDAVADALARAGPVAMRPATEAA